MEKEAKRIGVRFNSFLGTPANFDVDDKNEILAMEWTSAAGTMLDRLAGSEQPGGAAKREAKRIEIRFVSFIRCGRAL